MEPPTTTLEYYNHVVSHPVFLGLVQVLVFEWESGRREKVEKRFHPACNETRRSTEVKRKTAQL